ncbi:hypothetical protein [Owenweeksia hongkongensis]|uniref:hypothetical protein n=1 Tax=Owenweeksia hongkongensis TaxID=253245 RepID=UPI003A93082C
MIKRLFYSTLVVLTSLQVGLSQNYYLQDQSPSVTDMSNISNWNTQQDGSGSAAPNFNGGTWDLNGVPIANVISASLIINGNVLNSGTSCTIDVNGKILDFNGNVASANITIEDLIGGGSVLYTGNLATDVIPGTYNKIQLSGSGTKTAAGDIIAKELQLAGTGDFIFDMNTHVLSDSGSAFVVNKSGTGNYTITTECDSSAPIPVAYWPSGTKVVFNDAASFIPQHIPSGSYDILYLSENIKEIAAGDTVAIRTEFQNHTDLILQADTTSYAQLKTLVEMDTMNGSTVQKQYYLDVTTEKYFHRGTALDGADLQDLNNGQIMNFANNANGSVWKWDASTSNWTEPASTNNDATEGYAVYAGTNAFGTFLLPGSSGTVDVESNSVHFNDVNATLFYDDGTGSSATFVDAVIDGWNFVANPFLSNYDFEGHDLSGSTSGNMANYYYVLNGSNYSFYQKGGLTNGTGGTAPNGASAPRYIAPGQGVWFRTNAAWSGSTTFEAANQKMSGASQMFKTTATPDLLKIEVKEVNGSNSDQVLIRLDQNASDAEDFSMDVPKKSNTGDVPNTYVKLGNGTWALCAANSLRKSFPLHFSDIDHGQQMEYSITENSLTSYGRVFIEDKKNSSFTEITNANYAFVNDTTYSEDRFVIHFEKGVGLPEGMIPGAANYDAYYGNGNISFIFQEESFEPTTGGLYSLQGKLIRKFEVNEPNTKISVPNIPIGVYLISLDNDLAGARKLYINK